MDLFARVYLSAWVQLIRRRLFEYGPVDTREATLAILVLCPPSTAGGAAGHGSDRRGGAQTGVNGASSGRQRRREDSAVRHGRRPYQSGTDSRFYLCMLILIKTYNQTICRRNTAAIVSVRKEMSVKKSLKTLLDSQDIRLFYKLIIKF